jgi:hypothetical protein
MQEQCVDETHGRGGQQNKKQWMENGASGKPNPVEGNNGWSA